MPTKKAPLKKPTDAIALLKQDHEKVRGLLGQFEKSSGARYEKLRVQIEQELKVHTQIEEEIFYPAYRDAVRKKEDKKLYFEALEEHHVVDLVLPEVGDGNQQEQLQAKAKVLKELVEHHADEEEKSMFPRARKAIGREELRELGQRMQQRKEELKA
ncbi:MAG TPA: hemerythrin domain-containing protein [Thermoanaerobaculia bacterium]|nr:hemerythrin domain-containing protein [Thermoanaerobaculia bacterium]